VSGIRVEGLTKVYGSVRALDGLDLQVEPGTVFGFLGPNGAGKTTTLRILTGLARPTSGKAWVAGIDLGKDGRGLAKHIGHMPEEPAFYSWLTPREYLDYLGRLGALSAPDRAARIKELLGLVRLAEAGNRRIAGFSRGMRQRLALAAALVQRPEVLFLDEPVSALDPAGRKEVLELIDTLRGQCTVLMSTHILADVERICDAIGIIARGKLIVQSEREALLNQYATPVFELVSADAPALAAWTATLQQSPWVSSSSVKGDTARVVVNDLGTAKRGLLASAVQAGLALDRFEEIKPSLEDVFLQLVGEEGPQ
jgi:ABC-2 type transport system ATP-binding protein